MSVRDLLMAAAGAGVTASFVDDVFAATIFTGNGATQVINTGLPMASKGGLIWTKSRSNAANHYMYDTVKGIGKYQQIGGNTASNNDVDTLKAITDSGFTLGSSDAANSVVNGLGVAWSFVKAAKFFDIVSWAGNGALTRTIPHSLGVKAGFVIVKRLDTTDPYIAVGNSGLTGVTYLSSAATQFTDSTIGNKGYVNPPELTATGFGLQPDPTVFNGTNISAVNAIGGSYVAYVFAHDTSPDSIIKCGYYGGNNSATGPVIDLGWEPQFVLIKSGSSNAANWVIADTSRGLDNSSSTTADKILTPNVTSAEVGKNLVNLTPTGFQIVSTDGTVNSPNENYFMYIAIRRSNKPPTNGTQVYNAIARTGTGAATVVSGVGFTPDMITLIERTVTQIGNKAIVDRLRGNNLILTTAASVESAITGNGGDLVWGNDGFSAVATNPYMTGASASYINHFFKRAPSFFDIVNYKGDGDGSRMVKHNLGVIPELILQKTRDVTGGWTICSPAGLWDTTGFTTVQVDLSSFFPESIGCTKTDIPVYSLGPNTSQSNQASVNYVLYLFATLKGISKVGTYTGNGANQTINCGFTTGARFVMVKAADLTGDWYVWDTVRGIIVGNDPRISINASSVAEVTNNDSVDPATVGFIAKAAISNLGTKYMYLAIA